MHVISRRRLTAATAITVLAVTACGGEPVATTGQTAPTTVQLAPPSAPPTTAATTVSTAATTTSSAPTATGEPGAALGYTFRQVIRTEEAAAVSITYPTLIDLGDGAEMNINRALDDWAEQLADEFVADAVASGEAAASLLEVELAPEVRSRTIFSVSGLQFEFDAESDFSTTRRIGWIFSIEDGSTVAPSALFADGSLDRLAAAAESHLVADVLGDPDLLTAPAGLTATAENFDAVWLTPDGIAVGFDQYQVAAADAGSPAVLIPYAELADALDLTGVLAALEGDTLPAGF